MLQFLNTDILILVAMTAVAGALTSILLGKWIARRQEIKRVGWHEKEQRRIDAINQNLKRGP